MADSRSYGGQASRYLLLKDGSSSRHWPRPLQTQYHRHSTNLAAWQRLLESALSMVFCSSRQTR